MDLESGDTIYVEAVMGRGVRVTLGKDVRYTSVEAVWSSSTTTRLTTEEARTLANALLGAVVEAEAHQPR